MILLRRVGDPGPQLCDRCRRAPARGLYLCLSDYGVPHVAALCSLCAEELLRQRRGSTAVRSGAGEA